MKVRVDGEVGALHVEHQHARGGLGADALVLGERLLDLLGGHVPQVLQRELAVPLLVQLVEQPLDDPALSPVREKREKAKD